MVKYKTKFIISTSIIKYILLTAAGIVVLSQSIAQNPTGVTYFVCSNGYKISVGDTVYLGKPSNEDGTYSTIYRYSSFGKNTYLQESENENYLVVERIFKYSPRSSDEYAYLKCDGKYLKNYTIDIEKAISEGEITLPKGYYPPAKKGWSNGLNYKVDEFTKAEIIESAWTTVFATPKTCRIKFREVNDNFIIDFKYMVGIYSVSEGDNVMFLLEDGTVIKLYNPEYAISCLGCGATGLGGSEAYGLKLHLRTSLEELKPMLKSPIAKVRIYTSDGYLEHKANKRKAIDIMDILSRFYK